MGRQPGLQGPGPGPGTHLAPQGRRLALARGQQLPQLQGVGVDGQDHRIGRGGSGPPQQEEGLEELVVEQPRPLAQGREGGPVEARQQGSGQGQPPEPASQPGPGGHQGVSPSSRSSTGSVSIGAAKPFSSSLLRRRSRASVASIRRGPFQPPGVASSRWPLASW